MIRLATYLFLCSLLTTISAPAQEKINFASNLSAIKIPHTSTLSSYDPNKFFKPGDSTFHKGRFWLVAGGQAVIWAGSYVALNQAWYADYPKSSFHFFDDWDEWGKMDKLGHMWTAYNVA
ncbi:MAG: hypothetical protein C5B52_02360, partial [Bacteroidetes bacterium]